MPVLQRWLYFHRAAPTRTAFELLEPYDGKLSRTVLRGDRGGNTPVLPGP
ncbi:MAG: hypothetical protein ACE5HI_10965 [bacterium]